jgi:hypothetical protein
LKTSNTYHVEEHDTTHGRDTTAQIKSKEFTLNNCQQDAKEESKMKIQLG